ncbi:MAG: phosphatidylglycerophosphatase A [Campylobacterales bacterium]
MNKRLIFLSFFGAGLSKYAPGTMGTLAALPFGFLILHFLGATTLFLVAMLVTVISIREINSYEAEGGEHDDPRIVTDEVAGTFIALSMTAQFDNIWLQAILVFVFFRILDIKKPSLIGLAERKFKGGNGVMFDDLLAGIFAGILSWVVFRGMQFIGLSF